MVQKAKTSGWDLRRRELLDAEKRTGPSPAPGPYPAVVCYPNTYRAAMAGLGFQLVWDEAARHPSFTAERAFYSLSDKPTVKAGMPRSLESGKPFRSFETVFFSIQYELDYLNLYRMLVAGGLNPRAAERRAGDPLIIIGGIAPTANPEPLSPFADAFFLGDGEAAFGDLLDILAWTRGAPKAERLAELRGIPGVYLPALDEEPPAAVRAKSLDGFPASAPIITPHAGFGDTVLLEPIRGCPRECRFCLIGNAGGPVRIRRPDALLDEIYKTRGLTKKVSLIGSAISDHPSIDELVNALADDGRLVSVSSLNIRSVTEDLLNGIAKSGQRSLTFAPEAATDRMRAAVGKPLPDGRLEEVLGTTADAGFRSVKLYYLVGLPGETDADAEAVGAKLRTLADEFPALRLEASVNPFVPKRWTPWAKKPIATVKVIRSRLASVRRAIKGRVRVSTESPNVAVIQALLSLGDRRAAESIARRAGSARPHSRLTGEEKHLLEEFGEGETR
ncbi:MAG: radical SAM protein [Candidatus Coatesbacteria bacterium]|nr:MAG: radical SAM protein [Candidatus Coatesbacteria bacterium]